MNISINDKINLAFYEKKLDILSKLDKKIYYMESLSDMKTMLAKDTNGHMNEVYTEAANYYAGYADGLEKAKQIINECMYA